MKISNLLKGKVAVVTGAGRGLGEAISHSLASVGAHVVVTDIDFKSAKKVAAKISSTYNVKIIAERVDVTDEKEVKAVMLKIFNIFKKIDILISNVGIIESYEVTEFPLKIFKKIIDVNLTGYFICAKEVAKIMKKQGSGVIIQINSKSGKKGSYWNSAYSASKFGGIGLTQSLSLDLAPYGIRVNAICPGNLLDSPLWVEKLYDQYSKKWKISKAEVRKKYEEKVPLRRGCAYDDVNNLVIFLASDKSSYITGQAINVTGGQEMG